MVPFLSPVASTVPHLVPAVNVGVAPGAAGKTAGRPAIHVAIQYVAAPLTPFVRGLPAAAAAPTAQEAAGVEVA